MPRSTENATSEFQSNDRNWPRCAARIASTNVSFRDERWIRGYLESSEMQLEGKSPGDWTKSSGYLLGSLSTRVASRTASEMLQVLPFPLLHHISRRLCGVARQVRLSHSPEPGIPRSRSRRPAGLFDRLARLDSPEKPSHRGKFHLVGRNYPRAPIGCGVHHNVSTFIAAGYVLARKCAINMKKRVLLDARPDQLIPFVRRIPPCASSVVCDHLVGHHGEVDVPSVCFRFHLINHDERVRAIRRPVVEPHFNSLQSVTSVVGFSTRPVDDAMVGWRRLIEWHRHPSFRAQPRSSIGQESVGHR